MCISHMIDSLNTDSGGRRSPPSSPKLRSCVKSGMVNHGHLRHFYYILITRGPRDLSYICKKNFIFEPIEYSGMPAQRGSRIIYNRIHPNTLLNKLKNSKHIIHIKYIKEIKKLIGTFESLNIF
jgi:hypothetical protein